MLDFINVNTFRDISHFVIMLNDNKPFVNSILEQNAIIYCKTDYIPYLFSNLTNSTKKYILITGSSDYNINENIFLNKPKCIIKWFAQNINYNNENLIAIPIGLGPHKNIDAWVPDEKGNQYTIWYANNIYKLKNNEKNKKILYCNWNNNNNRKERINILNKLKDNKLQFNWGRLGYGENGNNDDYVSPYVYYNDLSKHKFTISPPGNGTDCHRTWEALYMNVFPVVIKHILYDEFKDLPIIQVNDYSEVTYDLLHSYLNKEYNYEKLYMSYWKNRILNEFNSL